MTSINALIAFNLSVFAFIFWRLIRKQNTPAGTHEQETAEIELQSQAIEPEQIDKHKIENPSVKHGPVFTRIGRRRLNYFDVKRFCDEQGYHYPSARRRRR